jgi:hypothetical protein
LNIAGGILLGPASPFHCQSAFSKAPWTSPSRIFQDLRADGHDRKQENTGGNPPSGHEKPELPSLVLFTPGNNLHHQIPSGEETYAENQSWKCACN